MTAAELQFLNDPLLTEVGVWVDNDTLLPLDPAEVDSAFRADDVIRCHLCRVMLDDDHVEAGGLHWCVETTECKFRARLRLGVGLVRSLQAKAADQHNEAELTERRAYRIASSEPPVRDPAYALVVNSPEWDAFSGVQKLAARYQCERCRAGGVMDIEVHHIHYKTLGHERPEDVLVVCPTPCHRELDRLRKAGTHPRVEIRVIGNPRPKRIVTWLT